MTGVSFVVPVHNGAASIVATVESILAQDDERPREIVVVDDGGDDDSSRLLQEMAARSAVHVVPGARRGAAAAVNTGIRAARHPIICQVDQDVVLRPDWTRRLVAELDDPSVGAAQGYYESDAHAAITARVMALDLELRYASIAGAHTDHVCTGNSVYRTSALYQVGLFDESLGYGYDNDMSYRLARAGYRLAFCREARSLHRWREGVRGYLVQQYGFGYGRLDVIAKHPRRVSGDAVSPAPLIAHAAGMTVAIAGGLTAAGAALAGVPWQPLTLASIILIAILALDRGVAGVRAAWRFGDPAALLFVPLHLARDLSWVTAIVVWTARRLLLQKSSPTHSMRSRNCRPSPSLESDCPAVPGPEARGIAVIPAFNEAASLPAVIAELRSQGSNLDVLVVDDGSTDRTRLLLPELGVSWLELPERLGVGTAMRTGLRCAVRAGYEFAVRVDGDGQHRAGDIDRLLGPILTGTADVAIGSRRMAGDARSGGPWLLRRTLELCLSILTSARVTDPTSGFYAIGPRALRVLAEHHPTGYPEPELRLFLSRNRLRVEEVPVIGRPRLGGTTSLTAARLTTAAARVLLAIVIVPVRGRI